MLICVLFWPPGALPTPQLWCTQSGEGLTLCIRGNAGRTDRALQKRAKKPKSQCLLARGEQSPRVGEDWGGSTGESMLASLRQEWAKGCRAIVNLRPAQAQERTLVDGGRCSQEVRCAERQRRYLQRSLWSAQRTPGRSSPRSSIVNPATKHKKPKWP